MDKNLTIIVKGLIKAGAKTRPEFINIKRKLSNGLFIPSPLNSDLLKTYNQLLGAKKIKPNLSLEKFLRKREVRTLSGVAVITVLTKAYSCPGKCIYCPSEKGMPKSYLSNEPAAARAKGSKFDPYKQVKVRLEALKMNGHKTDKIELIVLGGTWSCYPKNYQDWFLKRCFDALNFKTSTTLAKAQKLNEKAICRCVGLTLETRPDYINEDEVKRLRELGCTRVELGVQSIFDPILKLNQRGQTVNQTIKATALLRQAGLKITYHLMPGLPGSSLKKDLAMFKQIFTNPKFQPDMLKIYPCVVTKNSVLYEWYKKGKYKPYSDIELKNLLIKIKLLIPYYVRLARLIRDIPAESIVAGNKITNLRQIIDQELKAKKIYCRCIRCREAGHQNLPAGKMPTSRLFVTRYQAGDGWEYFLSFESKDRKILFAFLRLRLNNEPDKNFIKEIAGAALVRELHTYGELIGLGYSGKIQHFGFGKKLLAEAEKIAKKNRFKKIAVISGIGVREYYRKLGYKLDGTYMIKNL